METGPKGVHFAEGGTQPPTEVPFRDCGHRVSAASLADSVLVTFAPATAPRTKAAGDLSVNSAPLHQAELINVRL